MVDRRCRSTLDDAPGIHHINPLRVARDDAEIMSDDDQRDAELMRKLTRQLDVALIIITHNLGVVARYANRVNVMYAGRIVESGPAEAIYHRPGHPYTVALLRSVPRLDRPRQARLDPVDGQPPDLTRLDDGCAFRPRCRFAIEACAKSRPSLEPMAEAGHLSACFRSGELDRLLGAAA